MIVVMVDDQFDARPQSGLSQANVVWQAPAEGGIPRYMALFQTGNPPAVGPVRSSRLYFISWASEWRPVYVHAGGSPQAKALLRSAKGRGRYVYDADASAGAAVPVADPHPDRAAQRLHGRKHLRALARKLGAKPVPGQKPVWNFADPTRRSNSGRRAARSSSRTSPTRSPTSTTARQQHDTCAR